MVVEIIQIYGVHITGKCSWKSKKLKVDILTVPRQNVFPVPYHRPTARAEGD